MFKSIEVNPFIHVMVLNCGCGESENFYITKKYGHGCIAGCQKTFNVSENYYHIIFL